MRKKPNNSEINIYELILNLWVNKIKIIFITITFVVVGLVYFYSLDSTYKVTTNIKPISTIESQKYEVYNSLTEEILTEENLEEEILTEEILTEENLEEEILKKINRDSLLSIFINKLQTTDFIENAIIEFQLLNKDKFKDEDEYKKEINKTAILIIDNMTAPFINKDNLRETIPYWRLNFKINDKKTWIDFLKFIEKQANKEIRQILINRFNTHLKILNINSKFKLEDIEQKITNELIDYEIKIANRLVFLKEQAEIARALNIAKNSLEVENIQSYNTIITNIENKEVSYYLKGYRMIEKEISLISSRENEKAFIPNIINLEKNKRSILQSKIIERLKLLFSETPVNKNEFLAAKIDYHTTLFEPEKSLQKILLNSIVLGFLASLIYIFFNNIITSRK